MTKEEMEQQIHDFAEMMYKVGFEDGHEKCKNKIFLESAIYPKAMKDGYNQGLEAVWKYIAKLGKLTIGEIYEIFGDEYDNIYAITDDYSPSEFIDAIKEYEDKQKCKECKWDEFRDAQSPVGTPCDSCFEGKNFSPKVARCCSILGDICPYDDITCTECEVHCSVERAKQKLKGDKE